MDTRILIVADDRLARAGLATLLAGQVGYAIVGQVASEAALAPALELYRPDIVLWDLGWDAGVALERLADLHTAGALIVALLPDTRAGQVWRTGAQGILPRDVEPDALLAALSAVAQGLLVVAPRFAGAINAGAAPESSLPAEPLTPRELEVLRLLAEGLANKTIAQRLGISEHTVKFHINALLGKLAVQSRTEAVVKAMRMGLVSM